MTDVAAYTRLAGVYDELVVDPSYPLWADFIVEVWRDDPAGVDQVLDVCCGTGLMMAELRARGYVVVGVDASGDMLARARALLGPKVRLVAATLPELGVEGEFDAAVSTFDGLNYLTRGDFELSLAAIARRLRPGGWFIFDLHTDAMMAFTLANPRIVGDERGHAFVITSEVDPVARTCATTITMTPPSGDVFTERHEQFFHSDEQVRSALADAGFADVAVTQEYTDVPPGPATLRATWVARRH